MNTNLDFACTMCGNCCHDLRLPLTVTEALAWLARGDDVQILCEAVPWLEEPAADNLPAAHKRRRSFAAQSGSLPARIVVILTGAFVGPCPNLQSDMRCGIYEERPLVCRVYPAEINPFIELTPANKGCPPEAWTPGLPPLIRGGKLVDATTMSLIEQSRAADANDVAVKQRLCGLLGIDAAALSNEGFVVHSPRREDLQAALLAACEGRDALGFAAADEEATGWRFVSNRRPTVDALVSVGALGICVAAGAADDEVAGFEYLGFYPATDA
ncbi:YkgJ family cysteine cluster protein [Paraburkholderia sp. DHOC27]|uniref:YkgJ family cysteine cluster protein n=1 Tax=Paraburkholderia sp. DHOC27 TaxID=2303330 RepID=UPI000E3C642B|nr:YkgJ family cysteine cluster protein [Paraburkholderia sp. DHOC27]RFU44928.1 YkgJ family cysteine cluster protein [Paraburkholderia sp. DHOC27]